MQAASTPTTQTSAPITQSPASSRRATAAWTVSPTSLSFGQVAVGETASQSFTVTNTGNAPATIESASLNGAGFQLAATSFPISLNAGTGVTLQAVFAPSNAGSSSGTLSFKTSDSTVLSIALAGSGVVPVQHTVSLNWMASPSLVDGYYVYRGTQSGGPYSRINASPTTSTNYQDATVSGGMTYYYVVTAVVAGVESVPTGEMPAAIPSP